MQWRRNLFLIGSWERGPKALPCYGHGGGKKNKCNHKVHLKTFSRNVAKMLALIKGHWGKNAIWTTFFTNTKGTLPPLKGHFWKLVGTWPPCPPRSYAPAYIYPPISSGPPILIIFIQKQVNAFLPCESLDIVEFLLMISVRFSAILYAHCWNTPVPCGTPRYQLACASKLKTFNNVLFEYI
jgi:hypothetical protein